jgi:hypothetical protein
MEKANTRGTTGATVVPTGRTPARSRARTVALDLSPELDGKRQDILIEKAVPGALTDSLEKAGDRLFTFTRLPPTQWRSARTTNAIERLHEEFERRIKTQTMLPSARHRRNVVLGAARLRTDQHAQSWQTLAQTPSINR